MKGANTDRNLNRERDLNEAPTIVEAPMPDYGDRNPNLGSRYTIQGVLGHGGMGTVYRALDNSLHRQVAIKQLYPTEMLPEVVRARLLTEARALAAFNHDHIVKVWDVSDDSATPFIVAELVDGRDLKQLIRDEAPLSISRICAVLMQVCDGLEAAHGKGFIHRDIKPSNVLLAHDGTAKLTDFGLALQAGETSLSRSRGLMGTPGYMAPEQYDDASRVDQRADIYALGALLYHMATGESPQVIRLDGLPSALRDLLGTALATDPGRRFQAVKDFAEALREVCAAASAGGPALIDHRRQPPATPSVQASPPEGSATGYPCYTCGREVANSALFCQHCGQDLTLVRKQAQHRLDDTLQEAERLVTRECAFDRALSLLDDLAAELAHPHFARLRAAAQEKAHWIHAARAQHRDREQRIRQVLEEARQALASGRLEQAEELARSVAADNAPGLEELRNEARDVREATLRRRVVLAQERIAQALDDGEYEAALETAHALEPDAQKLGLRDVQEWIAGKRAEIERMQQEAHRLAAQLTVAEEALNAGQIESAESLLIELLENAAARPELRSGAESMLTDVRIEKRGREYRRLLQALAKKPDRILRTLAPLFAETEPRFGALKKEALALTRRVALKRLSLSVLGLVVLAVFVTALALQPQFAIRNTPLRISAIAANVRDGPDTDHQLIATLPYGQSVLARWLVFSKMDHPWIEVEVPGFGASGYISAKLLELAPSDPSGRPRAVFSAGVIERPNVSLTTSFEAPPEGGGSEALPESTEVTVLRTQIAPAGVTPQLWFEVQVYGRNGYVPVAAVRLRPDPLVSSWTAWRLFLLGAVIIIAYAYWQVRSWKRVSEWMQQPRAK